MRLPLVVLGLASALACGKPTSRPDFGASGDDGGITGPGTGLGGADSGADAPDNSYETDGCPASATLVYVTGEGDKLFSFYPPGLSFLLIGKFDCLTNPTHMTVDRQGNAWVVAGGLLYKASTKDATCVAVPNWQRAIEFDDFALSFVGVSKTEVDNTLYLLNGKGGLGAFDLLSGRLSNVGDSSLSDTPGDMTSNGDGTLYFLHDVSDPTLYRLNPKDASTLGSSEIPVAGGGSQALAFWGGSFYAFENNDISQYDPKAKTTTPIGHAPLQVTGAGQSTCVPKVPPPPK